MTTSAKRTARDNRVAVIGLGRFGTSVARELYDLGYEVTAIDLGEKQVREAAEYVTLAAQGDGTNRELLLQLNIHDSAAAVVAQGESLESSVLSTLLLKKLGVPWVVGKAKTKLHGELLSKVGADRVVFPERDAGIRLAHSIGVRNVSDYLSLSANAGIARLSAPPELANRTVAHALDKQAHKISILMIMRGTRIIASPGPDVEIQAGDQIVIAGSDAEIATFAVHVPVASANGRDMAPQAVIGDR